MPSDPEPLVVAEDLRIDTDGEPSIDGLTLRSSGEHVLLLGAPSALFDALTGLRSPVRGALRIRGEDPAAAVSGRRVAGAPFAPPLPPRWTATEYVTWSARLAGLPKAAARTKAAEAIAALQLDALAKTRLEGAVPHARRAVVVAAALATGADVLVLQDPLADLAEEDARTWARLLVKALEGKAWIALLGRVALTSPLAIAADEAIVVTASRLAAQGRLAELASSRRFVARVHGALDGFARELAARGASLEVQGAQVLLDLGPSLAASEVLALAADTGAVVVELVPLALAIA
ncbi:MAG: transporter related protein [Labilithrix sp.]|nr:transporter related protein [Labilithrix sp.]